MNNRVNFNRRSGRQNFSNCNGAPVEEEEQFKNRRVSPRRSARRTPNRRSGRQNFRNKRAGKERFQFSLFTKDTLTAFEMFILLVVISLIIFGIIHLFKGEIIGDEYKILGRKGPAKSSTTSKSSSISKP